MKALIAAGLALLLIGAGRPQVRSLPWEDAAPEMPQGQGWASAIIEIENDCYLWTVRLFLDLITDQGRWMAYEGSLAGRVISSTVERAVRPGMEELCIGQGPADREGP